MSRQHRGNQQHEQADLDEVLSPRLAARFVKHLLADEEAIDDALDGGPGPVVASVARSGCFEAALAADRREAHLVDAAVHHAADAAPALRALGRLADDAGRDLFDWAPNRRAQVTAPSADAPAARAAAIGAVLGGAAAAYAVRARVPAGSSYDALARAIAAVAERIDAAVHEAGVLAREHGISEAARQIVAAGTTDAATLVVFDGATGGARDGAAGDGALDGVAGGAHDGLAGWTGAFFHDGEVAPRAGLVKLPPVETTSERAAVLTRWAAEQRTARPAAPARRAAAPMNAMPAATVASEHAGLATVAAPDELGRLRAAGDLAGLVEAIGVRGAVALEQGSWAAAIRLLEEAAAVNAAVQRPAHAAQALIGVTVALRGSGRADEAVGAARRAVALAPGGPSKVAALAALGEVEAAAGSCGDAVRALDDAIAMGRMIGLLSTFVDALVQRRERAAARG